jgi:simple sugar transport system permease protein
VQKREQLGWLMDALLYIPVLGFILQFLIYLVHVIGSGHIAPIILGLATPIALGALCGVLNERSGVVNIGIEGMLLFSAYVAFMTVLLVHQTFPAKPSPFFGATPALILGVVAAIAAGVLISLLHAWLSITVRADQIISGTIINITALGLTSYLNRLIKPFDSAGTFESLRPPGL